MTTIVHIIDVGQGNMAVIQADNGNIFVFDCNITDQNERRVLNDVENRIGRGAGISAFICSHRDADHIRGIRKLHDIFPIEAIWDSGYPGTTTGSPEYLAYMDLRRRIGGATKKRRTYQDFGRTRLRYLSAQDERLAGNANAQGIVIKAEHRTVDRQTHLSSVLLPGDSDAQTWRKGIMLDYASADISSSILMASHHGSISFFDDPDDDQHYYTNHLKSISPGMTIVSVGPNLHGHPDATAMRFYERYSSGSNKGNKVYRTDEQRSVQIVLKDSTGWNISTSR